jgi:hypothetical protein
MSGIVQNNILRSSGTIAVTAAGLSWDTAVVTGSTVTVEAGNGYWINTTSNTCTITLPSSAEAGDQIVLIDYARTWGTNKIIIDSNGLNYQGNPDTYTVEYTTDGQSVNIVYSDATKGWVPLEDDVTALEPVAPATQKAIIAFGFVNAGSETNAKNLVASNGTIASDATGVGTARTYMAAATYGTDKGIMAFGSALNGTSRTGISNLVSNEGVVASDTSAVGTARQNPGASGFGTSGQAIFAYGSAGSNSTIVNIISNSGVVASDSTGAGSARNNVEGVRYGVGLAIFAYGDTGSATNISNKITSSGGVGADITGVGTARYGLGATSYGTGTAIFAYGYDTLSMSNLVNTSGTIASDVSGVGTGRHNVAATNYGGNLGLFAYGLSGGTNQNMSNRVNSSGVVQSDTTGVGTARVLPVACGYSITA